MFAARDVLERAGIAATGLAAVGDPADEILKAAKQVEAELVVMGARSLGTVERLVLGLVSTKVMHEAARWWSRRGQRGADRNSASPRRSAQGSWLVWIAVETAMLGYISWMQPATFAAAVLIVLLAGRWHRVSPDGLRETV